MNILLVYPPQGDPSQPYLSIPALKGFLHTKGYASISQRDLNVEAYDYLTSEQYLKGAVERINRCYRNLLEDKNLSEDDSRKLSVLARSLTMAPYVVNHIERAKRCFRNKSRFYNYAAYLKSSYVLQRALEIASSEFYPTRLNTYSFIMKYSADEVEQITTAMLDEKQNIFIPFFKNKVLPSIIAAKPDFIGISVTYDSQLIPGLTFARLIKNAMPHSHVCIGGGYISNLHHIIEKDNRLFQFVDSYIVHEGETAIFNLLRMLEGKKHACFTMSNIIWCDRENGKINRGRDVYIEDINSLPPADFAGLPMTKYFSPEPVLLLDIERGCYWGKCSFCSYGAGIGPCSHYRPRSEKRIAEILKHYQKEHHIKHVVFSTDAAAPRHLEKIADELMRNKINVNWHCTSRVEKDFTLERCKKLEDAGCRHVIFGVESGSQKVLDAMGKGITLKTVSEVFEILEYLGITNKSMFIVGFPGEEWDGAMDTRDFILNNQELFSFISLEPFSLLEGSLIQKTPSKFHISRLWKDKEKDLSFSYKFETSKGMRKEEIQQAYSAMWNCIQPIFHGRCYPFIESGASVHTLLYSSRYGRQIPFQRDLFKARYRDIDITSVLKLKPELSADIFMVEHPTGLFERDNGNGSRVEKLDVGATYGERVITFYNITGDTLFTLDQVWQNLLGQLSGQSTIEEMLTNFPPSLAEKALSVFRYLLFAGVLVERDGAKV